MKLIHITTCTNRKKIPVSDGLLCRNLPYGIMTDVADEWVRGVKNASQKHFAYNLYCGRGFAESLSAARIASTDLWVISAGLGLINVNDEIPSYGLTISPGVDDSISGRIQSDFQPSAWWKHINRIFGRSLTRMIESESEPSAYVISLTQPYAPLVMEDLLGLRPEYLDRVRIVGLMSKVDLPEKLHKIWMPYDARINDPSCCPGTMSDFAQRAAHHFVKNIWCQFGYQSAETDAKEITNIMDKLKVPIVPKRLQLNDQEVCDVIKNNWGKAQGYSSRMLRILRDDLLIACEQKRFSVLFNQVKKGMI